MLSSLLVVYFAASSAPLAAAKTFYWSYQGENGTDSYDPVFEICAPKNATSCGDCNTADDNVGAKSCHSELYNNICYEPKREETCCKDKYGTSCYKDFYCAYTSENIAFCCADGEDVEDCGKTFNETLSKDQDEADDDHATATVTSAFNPSMTATDQTRVARPERTTPPNVVPGSTKTQNKDPDVEKKMSAAVKIGIAIAAFAGVAILVTLAVMALLHWRKRTKYNAIGHSQAEDKLLAKHPEPFNAHAVPRPISSAPGPFEPMRNEPPHDSRQSWMASPPPNHSGPTTPSPFSAPAAYSDHPSQPHQSVELSHLPPRDRQ
ncbi:hypothetical protein N0V90_006248 [Kalmusia sp. IMI 367209]|nr:hypothetical protein N0V90_006248 [Kalmusia sp. IMI 367209]